MKKQILPSLLSADFSQLRGELDQLKDANIESLHLDVMDGHYVPNLSFGPALIQSLRPHCGLFFDVHLMVEEPSYLYPALKKAGADLITVHQEACRHLHRDLQEIHKEGMKAGVALNPATPVSLVEPILCDVELVLVMSVNPGFGGQSFIEGVLPKIRRLQKLREEKNFSFLIEADGGIKEKNMDLVLEAGCDWLVSGSGIFSGDGRQTKERAQSMLERLEKWTR